MNICKVVFYYIGILTVSIVFVKMLYELVTKKYKKKLVVDDSRKNTKIQYFQIFFYIVGIIFSGICVQILLERYAYSEIVGTFILI